MSYEHRSNINRKRISTKIKIVVLICILIFIINIIAPQFLSSSITSLIRPFWNNKEIQGISTELKDATVSQLKNENTELKKALDRGNASSTVMSYILKKPPYTAYDIYIIDIGLNKNLKKGDKVYSIGNVLLGEIGEVNTNTSKVKLYSSYGEKYEILIGNNIEATAIGKGGGTFEVILPKGTEIKENDIVTVPNINVSVFGIVRKITIDPAKTFNTILFAQPVNIYEQKIVLIDRSQ